MAHRGRYNPDANAFGIRRDRIYPSEIAEDRPALVTRIHCMGDYGGSNPDNTLRGVEREEYPSPDDDRDRMEGRVALFNRQLREGHGGRNSGEE